MRSRRRRPGTLVVAALVAAPIVLAPPAAAEEATAGRGTTLCTITDPRLAELSGLVVLGDRMVAVADGGDELDVLVLDSSCAVTDLRTAPVDPYDPEDLAVSADGTLWVADTGDNAGSRSTVALHALRSDGTASLHRLTYPDAPHDCEALLLAPDGTPYLVTKEVLGASQVFRPAGELRDGGTVALEQVATLNLTLTGTVGGPVGRAGQLLVTGGAVSRDGRMIALRTYTDAYLWPLTGSDVPAALGGDPLRIPLPDSPQGEAISFGAGDRGIVIASEGSPNAVVVVPTEEPAPGAEQSSPAAEQSPGNAQPSLPEEGADGVSDGGRSLVTSGLIALAVAAAAVWLGGKLRRRRP